jgi:hypothetical protein
VIKLIAWDILFKTFRFAIFFMQHTTTPWSKNVFVKQNKIKNKLTKEQILMLVIVRVKVKNRNDPRWYVKNII